MHSLLISASDSLLFSNNLELLGISGRRLTTSKAPQECATCGLDNNGISDVVSHLLGRLFFF